ncbi:hypothetical protein FPV67DRAFT_107993 [Lyophyllum atratum]|nr:hypothetical protein FPV67DRAFT_107993 [Lyophyllum atratum]
MDNVRCVCIWPSPYGLLKGAIVLVEPRHRIPYTPSRPSSIVAVTTHISKQRNPLRAAAKRAARAFSPSANSHNTSACPPVPEPPRTLMVLSTTESWPSNATLTDYPTEYYAQGNLYVVCGFKWCISLSLNSLFNLKRRCLYYTGVRKRILI